MTAAFGTRCFFHRGRSLFISPGEMKPLVMNRHCTVWIVCIHEIGQNDLAGMSSAGDWCGGDIAHPECQMVSPFLLSEGV